MKPLAFITIVRNESFFLSRWVEYYGRTGADLFVLDHESDDGSTDNLPAGVTRIPVWHPECERAAWLLEIIQGTMEELLQRYDRVGYFEVDEFAVPNPHRWQNLKAFLDEHPHDFISLQGMSVIQQPGDPPPPAVGEPLLAGRSWKRDERYDMTLIGRQVPRWKIGRHGLEDRPNGPDMGLALVHCHYLDKEIGWARILGRKKGKEFARDGCGVQNKFDDRSEFDVHWDQMCCGGEPIPDHWWVI